MLFLELIGRVGDFVSCKKVLGPWDRITHYHFGIKC